MTNFLLQLNCEITQVHVPSWSATPLGCPFLNMVIVYMLVTLTFILYSGELAKVVRFAEEQSEEVREERAANERTQITRECGMSVWRVVYAEITALTFHTHTHKHTHTLILTHTTHTHTHHTHTHHTHTHITHTHTQVS